MRRMIRTRIISPTLAAMTFAAAAFSIAAPLSPPAHAQQVVYDPANHAENILTATRALEQIRHQIAQIENQTRMLARNSLQLSPELARSIDEARALFETAEGLAYDIDRIASDIETLYPATWDAYDLDTVLAQSDRWMTESRVSLRAAMQAEARAAQSIVSARTNIDAGLNASATAEGQTSAIQAGNQLLGVNAAELAEIHALLVIQGRALQTERMERLAREERALEIRRRAFPTTRPASADPARSAF